MGPIALFEILKQKQILCKNARNRFKEETEIYKHKW